VTPFARDPVAARDHGFLHDEAAPDAGAQDDAEHHARVRGRAVDRLGKGEAIGVVLQPDLTSQSFRKVAVERLAVQPDRVGILESFVSVFGTTKPSP